MSNLQSIRHNQNISQSKLAYLSGVKTTMIQKYEAGFKDINKAQALTIYNLAKALNCNMSDLLEIDNK